MRRIQEYHSCGESTKILEVVAKLRNISEGVALIHAGLKEENRKVKAPLGRHNARLNRERECAALFAEWRAADSFSTRTDDEIISELAKKFRRSVRTIEYYLYPAKRPAKRDVNS